MLNDVFLVQRMLKKMNSSGSAEAISFVINFKTLWAHVIYSTFSFKVAHTENS